MKLSEKTLELNLCAQASRHVGSKNRLLWFGLTQKQEARAGFDACTKLGGRLLIFQFKASNRILKSKDRVFLVPHDQLIALRTRAGSHRRSIFYAFPLVGSTSEFKANPDLLPQTWLVNITSLSAVGAPTKADGSPRRNNCHNVYVKPGKAIFHSDPVEVNAIDFETFVRQGFPGADGMNLDFHERFESFWELAREFSQGARALVLW